MEKSLHCREEIILIVYGAFVNLLLLLGNIGLYLFAPERGLPSFAAAVLTVLLLLLCFLRLRLKRAVCKEKLSPTCLWIGRGMTTLHFVLVSAMAILSLLLCITEALFFPVLTDLLLLALNGGDILLRFLH